jgi:hypothetical protein
MEEIKLECQFNYPLTPMQYSEQYNKPAARQTPNRNNPTRAPFISVIAAVIYQKREISAERKVSNT